MDGEFSSVADQGCLSRIPDPDFYPSRIPDPKTGTKEKGEKKIVVIPFFQFFCSHKFHNIVNYFIFEMLKKKIWANFQKYGFGIRDPRSGKNLFRIPNPEVKKAPDTGSQIRLRNTAIFKIG
jgi:hypothetical protein